MLHGSRDGDFAMLQLGDAQLSLLAHPPNPEQNEGTVESNFETSGPLERVEESLMLGEQKAEVPILDGDIGLSEPGFGDRG